jgi:putative hydrolase of the HAD superfamily
MARLVVFDGDDTLWSTEPLYDSARAAARRIVERVGLDGARWEAVERVIDVANVTQHGMSPVRFPTSCVDALEHVAGGPVDPALRQAVWDAAAAVFASPAPLMEGAKEVVGAVAREHHVALLTKGDPEVQERRVDTSGLRHLLDRVEVVPEKSASSFASLAWRLGVPPGEAISVGNSLRSDVLPAVEAGMAAVWIDAPVWEWERTVSHDVAVPDGVVVASSLADVLRALKTMPTCA